MTDTFELNGRQIVLKASSDRVVYKRVLRHIQRRIEEDDWRPYRSRSDALRAWARLGGIRMQVLEALNLL